MKTTLLMKSSALVCGLVGAWAAAALAAGAVTVTPGGGSVSITGDADANSIKITDPDADGDFTITGAGGTTVNGGASAQTGVVTSNFSVLLAGGDDSIKMKGGSIPGSLTINNSTGNDKVSLSDVTVGTFLHFEGNDGDDKLKIKTMTMTDMTDAFYSSIDMDDVLAGADQVSIKGMVDASVEVTLGDGNDKFGFASAVEPASPFGRLHVDAGAGTDKLQVKSVTVDTLIVETGAGDGDILKILKTNSPEGNTLTDAAGTGDKLIDKGNALGPAALGTPSGFGD